jgi:hypothetical protein
MLPIAELTRMQMKSRANNLSRITLMYNGDIMSDVGWQERMVPVMLQDHMDVKLASSEVYGHQR